VEGIFELPKVFFTLEANGNGAGNPKSRNVIEEMRKRSVGDGRSYEVFASPDDVEAFFRDTNITPASAVVLYDVNLGHRHFHPDCRNRRNGIKPPQWTHGAQWVVQVGNKCDPSRCARQMCADFGKNFAERLAKGRFPWGSGKLIRWIDRLTGRGEWEMTPAPVSMPQKIHETIKGLNQGPDLAAAVTDRDFAAELPAGSRISWFRIVPEPVGCDREFLHGILCALRAFEGACGDLVASDEAVRDTLLSGVHLPEQSGLAHAYLSPKVRQFSVGRPDLHWTGVGLPFASEIDEMPGGMPELVHIDATYGINQSRWKRAFDWLCGEGMLVFLVSSGWSRCYIPETKWLVEHMQRLGYPVRLLTTDRVDEIARVGDHLQLCGERIGTIWRQFPVFEVGGALADVVLAASEDGIVRMVPEFAHFGNKAWFSVFRSHKDFYQAVLSGETFALLDRILPHSYIVGGVGAPLFPFRVGGHLITDLSELKNASQEVRDSLVLKICGANDLAARSYGVLMGKGIPEHEWREWITTRITREQPFIVQHRLDQGVARLPVMNTKTGFPELFSCRILLRPWSIDGELVSVHGCAVPSHLFKVHGMVDMAVVPFTFD
jgi:hypothetical protein